MSLLLSSCNQALVRAFRRRIKGFPYMRVRRLCTPELWHFDHTKSDWSSTVDGQKAGTTAKARTDAEGEWRLKLKLLDGPEMLEKLNETEVRTCLMMRRTGMRL